MNYSNYSEQQLNLIKKFLSDITIPNHQNIIKMIDAELSNRMTEDEKAVTEFKEKMIQYIGKIFKVVYNNGLIIYYKINDVAIQNGATNPYNVILDSEELVFNDGQIEYREKSNDLRLDNTDIERLNATEIDLDRWNELKNKYDNLIKEIK